MKRRFNKDRSSRSLTDGTDKGRRGASRNVVHRIDHPSPGNAGRLRSLRGRRADPPLTAEEDAAVRAQRLPELAAMLLAGDPDRPVRERLRETFGAMGYQGEDLATLEEGLLALMVREVRRKHDETLAEAGSQGATAAEPRPAAAGPPVAAPVGAPIGEAGAPESDPDNKADLYERRIAKLMEALGESRAELARIHGASEGDAGVASIYRDVQGLSPEAKDAESKRQMMSVLFQANLELKNELQERE